MIRDLSKFVQDPNPVAADVLIVGSGIAGLLMATRLVRLGLRVVVMESGVETQDHDTHPLNETLQVGAYYAGADHGRFRCLGGTSTRWGGALIPFEPEDMARNWCGENFRWEVRYEELFRYLPEAERLFGLPPGDYTIPGLITMRDGSASEFVARMPKWPAFKRRNVAKLLRRQLISKSGPEIWLSANATQFKISENGLIESVLARSPGGRTLLVNPKSVVIAAGAIESTRLLLLLDRQYGERIFAADAMLGRYFYDHLSAHTSDLNAVNPVAFNKLIAFRFERGIMRNLRFELTETARRTLRLPAAFCHISAAATTNSGFDALREIYRTIQRGNLPPISEFGFLARDCGWLMKAIWWRWVERQLLAPKNAKYELHVVIEQTPSASNTVSLSPDRVDVFGSPLAVIDWQVGKEDCLSLIAVYKRFASMWQASNHAHLAKLAPLGTEGLIANSSGIYHPGGTARIGISPRTGVVDRNLRTFQIANLRVVTTAVFPTGGSANPTLMLIMFALRAADQIAAELKPVLSAVD